MKRCTHCRMEKRLDAFPRAGRMSDGRSSWCRSCHHAATRAWRKRNPEKVAAYYTPVVNASRVCSECGGEFVPGRKDALVCGQRCRWRRDRRLRKAAA